VNDLGNTATREQVNHAALAVEVNRELIQTQYRRLTGIYSLTDSIVELLTAYVTGEANVLVNGLIARPDLIAYQIRKELFPD
jgi:hypothetical protein